MQYHKYVKNCVFYEAQRPSSVDRDTESSEAKRRIARSTAAYC